MSLESKRKTSTWKPNKNKNKILRKYLSEITLEGDERKELKTRVLTELTERCVSSSKKRRASHYDIVLSRVVFSTRRIIIILINTQMIAIELARILIELHNRLKRTKQTLEFTKKLRQLKSQSLSFNILGYKWNDLQMYLLTNSPGEFDFQEYAMKVCPYPLLIIKKRLAMEWTWSENVNDLSDKKEKSSSFYRLYRKTVDKVCLKYDNCLLKKKKFDEMHQAQKKTEKNKKFDCYTKKSWFRNSKLVLIKPAKKDFCKRTLAKIQNLTQELTEEFRKVETINNKKPSDYEYHTNLEVIGKLTDNLSAFLLNIENQLDMNLKLIEKIKYCDQDNQNMLNVAIKRTRFLKEMLINL